MKFRGSPPVPSAEPTTVHLSIHSTADAANTAATECLARWLTSLYTRNVMVTCGNTSLELYRRIAEQRLRLSRLNLFALDEDVGVPLDEPRSDLDWTNYPGRFYRPPLAVMRGRRGWPLRGKPNPLHGNSTLLFRPAPGTFPPLSRGVA